MSRYSLILLLASISTVSHAAEVKIPVVVSHGYLEQVFKQQVFTRKGEYYANWEHSGCQYLILKNPRISSYGKHIQLIADVDARLGRRVGKKCIVAVEWSRKIKIIQSLRVAKNGQQVFGKVVQSHLLEKSGETAEAPNTVWQWVNNLVHPKLNAVAFDLRKPIRDIKKWLYHVVPNISRKEQFTLVNSLRITKTYGVASGVQFVFSINFPQKYRAANARSFTPLTKKERQNIPTLLNQLDGFYSAILTESAIINSNEEILEELLSILMDFRHEVSQLFHRENLRHNPVPELFISTWTRLSPVLKNMSKNLSGHQDSLRFLSFITAGEAMISLKQAGPKLGVDLSPRGMMRLGQLLLNSNANPIAYNQGVNSKMRKAFGFGPPLKISANPTSAPRSYFVKVAATEAKPPKPEYKINQIIPNRKNLNRYLPLAFKMLQRTTNLTIVKSKLDSQYHDTYRWMVTSTAWKESCWRQYVRNKGERAPLVSNAGAVGIMQIVPRIWRGFYEVDSLKWDFFYNTRAGAEILMRYMRRYAIRKKEHHHKGGLDNLARATYAAYNAGPGKLNRYRRKNATKRQKQVDRSYYEKFLKVKNGEVLGVKDCF